MVTFLVFTGRDSVCSWTGAVQGAGQPRGKGTIDRKLYRGEHLWGVLETKSSKIVSFIGHWGEGEGG